MYGDLSRLVLRFYYAGLREICPRVAHRLRVFGEWGFDRKLSRQRRQCALRWSVRVWQHHGRGIVAHKLPLELYKIVLAGVISKYTGDTEKNLDRIFKAVENSKAIFSLMRPTLWSASARNSAILTIVAPTSKSPACCKRWKSTKASPFSPATSASVWMRPSALL